MTIESILCDFSQHHEKYMVSNSGSIQNGQFLIYFSNKFSPESIYEKMKGEMAFSCAIPKKHFLTEPNKDCVLPTTLRKWRWKKESMKVEDEWSVYSFRNCYQIEHAIENEHDSVVVAVKELEMTEVKDENTEMNQQKRKRKQTHTRTVTNLSMMGSMATMNIDAVAEWHLIVFNEDHEKQSSNAANISPTQLLQIDSETCHFGTVSDIDWDSRRGKVENKDWNSMHQFVITDELQHVLKRNCHVSYHLSVPSSFKVSVKRVTADECIAGNVTVEQPISEVVEADDLPKLPSLLQVAHLPSLTLTRAPSISPSASRSSRTSTSSVSARALVRVQHQFATNQPIRRHSTASHYHRRSKSRHSRNSSCRFSLHPDAVLEMSRMTNEDNDINMNQLQSHGRFQTAQLHNILIGRPSHPQSTPHRLQNLNRSEHRIDLSQLSTMEAESVMRHITDISNQMGSQMRSPVEVENPRDISRDVISPLELEQELTRCRQSNSGSGAHLRNLSVLSPSNSLHRVIVPSPTHSMRSHHSMLTIIQSPENSIGNIALGPLTPSARILEDHELNEEQMECSESREKSDKICMFTMDTWTDQEFAEFLRLIGQTNCISIFRQNGTELEHFMKIDEAALRSMDLPPVHIQNLLEKRDYYLKCDEMMQSLPDERELANMERTQMVQQILEMKQMMKEARISRRKAKNKRCNLFQRKHHEQIQILKAVVDAMETELATKVASERHRDDEKQEVLHHVVGDGEDTVTGGNNIDDIEGQCMTTETGYSDFEENQEENQDENQDAPDVNYDVNSGNKSVAGCQVPQSPGKCDEYNVNDGDRGDREETYNAEDYGNMHNASVIIQSERYMVVGCNSIRSCIGVVVLQSMNMNYVKVNFGESKQNELTLSMEKNLSDVVNMFLIRIGGSLRVNIYKNTELMTYTLVLWDSDNSQQCMTLDAFTDFLKSDLLEIGLRIPSHWELENSKRKLWKKQSAKDIYCDMDVLTKTLICPGHKQHRSISSHLDLRGFDNSDGEYSMSKSKSVYSQSAFSRNEMRHQKSASNFGSSHLTVQRRRGSSVESAQVAEAMKSKKHKRSPSKTKKLMKSLASPIKRLSMRKRKSKKSILVDLDETVAMDELRRYGMDNDEISPRGSKSNDHQIYFSVGSVHVAHKDVNLYQVIEGVRVQLNKELKQRKKRSQKNNRAGAANNSNLLFVNSV